MCRRVLLLLFMLLAGCGAREADRPYVLLISFDGFRHDYPELHGASNLLRIAQEGVRADGLIPSYRSNTFPNHTAIITGLYPEHHGIVDNNFYDRQRNQFYVYKQSDGSFFGGIPLWVLAERQGVRTASFFWPGSDKEIQGGRPSKFFNYDDTIPIERRFQQVLEWFRLPEAERPHFVTMYFEHIDTAGHDYGPAAPETKAAVSGLDAALGSFLSSLRESGPAVNVFVVSDHGMMQVQREGVNLGTRADFPGFEISPASGSQIMLYSQDQALIDRTYARLNGRDPRYRVFRRMETPEYLHYRNNPRIGELVIMAAAPVALSIDRPEPWQTGPGAHGYDPQVFSPQMNGIFFAAGPDIRPGVRIPAFANVHIYPLIARILQLEPPADLDGSLDVLKGILRDQSTK